MQEDQFNIRLLDLVRNIREATVSIYKSLEQQKYDLLDSLFEYRQILIDKYISLESRQENSPEREQEEQIRLIFGETLEINQKIERLLYVRREKLLDEMKANGQAKEVTQAYSNPYDLLQGPYFIDKKE
ncbi:flagellar protein FliT [Effusibacillus consociatus]|uniref:Flagellar protein FliT n=1 Tax=Effusibacillus consociatus TaxID=1117041 RepID=A0ABV9Q1U8_9BACL